MKSHLNNLLKYLLIFIIFSMVSLVSCKKTDLLKTNNEDQNTRAKTLTIQQIKDKYANLDVIDYIQVGNDYVLVNSKTQGSANKFELYDLEKGNVIELPTMPKFTNFYNAKNENDIVLLATGRNSETINVSFPFLIHFFRDSSKQNFLSSIEDYYLKIGDKVEFGDYSKTASITLVKQKDQEIEIQLTAVPGKESEFYADSISIPMTHVEFNLPDELMIMTVDKAKIMESSIINENDNNTRSIVDIGEKDDGCQLKIRLYSHPKEYTIKSKVIDNNSLLLKIIFK